VDGIAVRVVGARIDQDRRLGDAILQGQPAHDLGVRVRAVPGRPREDEPRRPAGPKQPDTVAVTGKRLVAADHDDGVAGLQRDVRSFEQESGDDTGTDHNK
jgi:hypothetical protein